jgi:hypothetical protein
MLLRKTLLAAGALFALSCGAAHAAVAIDNPGDWAIGFPGPNDPDLDVLSFGARYDASTSSFLLTAKMAGAINTSIGGTYVIGANTGTGVNHPFGPQGAPNVKFNQVIVLQRNGTGAVSGHALTPTYSGDMFSVWVPLSFLPSTGAATPFDYSFNLWPRNAGNKISDFAPDDSMLSAVPEPKVWAMLITGFALLGAAIRRRSAAAFARPA